MSMPSCSDVTEMASAFVDGELPWNDRATLWVHLMMCPPCKAYLDQFGFTVESLKHLSEPLPPEQRDAMAEIYRAWRKTNS